MVFSSSSLFQLLPKFPGRAADDAFEDVGESDLGPESAHLGDFSKAQVIVFDEHFRPLDLNMLDLLARRSADERLALYLQPPPRDRHCLKDVADRDGFV